MTINVRTKGASGEREFCKWLQKTLILKELPTRNLEQTRWGGADILGIGNFVFEVKRCETLQLRKWWLQNIASSWDNKDAIPIVAYRQNRKKWNFLISAKYIGLRSGFIHMLEPEFTRWIQLEWEKFNK